MRRQLFRETLKSVHFRRPTGEHINMSSSIRITVSIISDREPPKDTTALYNEDVPINTHLQLVKNLQHWRWQFKAVEWVTKHLYKPKYSLTEKADKVKEVLTLTSGIKGKENYWVIVMTTLLLKTIFNTVISSQSGCKKTFCLKMCQKLDKLATILDKPNQGGHRWKRIQKNMIKKLVKMGKQNNYLLCIHPDELTIRMLLVPLIRMLIKTIKCLDNPTPSEPQPKIVEEKKKEPQYKPKQKKKKKNY